MELKKRCQSTSPNPWSLICLPHITIGYLGPLSFHPNTSKLIFSAELEKIYHAQAGTAHALNCYCASDLSGDVFGLAWHAGEAGYVRCSMRSGPRQTASCACSVVLLSLPLQGDGEHGRGTEASIQFNWSSLSSGETATFRVPPQQWA